MSRDPGDGQYSGGFDVVTAASVASLVEEVEGTVHEEVVLELAVRTIRGRRALEQLHRLANVIGPGTSWSYLRKLTERVERLAALEQMPEVGPPRGADARRSGQHLLETAEVLSEASDPERRRRFKEVARWFRKQLAEEAPGEETE